MKRQNILGTVIAALAILAATSFSALQASDVKYTYVEGRFILDAELDDTDVDGDGFNFGGSYRFTNEIYAFGSIELVDLDRDVDLKFLEAGVGYIYPINTQWDSNFTFSLLQAEAEFPNGQDEDDTGFAISAGARGMITPKIETRGKLTYADADGSDTFITIAGDYFVLPNLAVGAEADLAADYETLSIGVRYFFN